jgi:hypothetical protein
MADVNPAVMELKSVTAKLYPMATEVDLAVARVDLVPALINLSKREVDLAATRSIWCPC